MRAAWYEKQGPAGEVLVVGEMPDIEPGPGEVRIRMIASGINPGDIKKRQNSFGYGMSYPRVIPHSDGAGVIDKVGEGITCKWVGRRVWCYGAQSYRPFGTAAEYGVVPASQVVELPNGLSYEQGACLGIPGITAHQAVNCAGSVKDLTVLVQGGAGAVGLCAVRLAHLAGAEVIASVRSLQDEFKVRQAGADKVLKVGDNLIHQIKRLKPNGVNHIIEVDFAANIQADAEFIAPGGTIVTYASQNDQASIPFWPLVFANAQIIFLGSDDFAPQDKADAAAELNKAFSTGWKGFEIFAQYTLNEIVRAHETMESKRHKGRIIIRLDT